MSMPVQAWLNIACFDHWIEDSALLRWARLAAKMNRTDEVDAGRYFGLPQTPGDERDRTEVRRLLRAGGALVCVWTGVALNKIFRIGYVVRAT